MIDIPNNLISAIGMVNGTCAGNGHTWQINYIPDTEPHYLAYVGPSDPIEDNYIDNLFEKMIKTSNSLAIPF
jgi:hypothetical protein